MGSAAQETMLHRRSPVFAAPEPVALVVVEDFGLKAEDGEWRSANKENKMFSTSQPNIDHYCGPSRSSIL